MGARRGTSWLWGGTVFMAVALAGGWALLAKDLGPYDTSFHVPWWVLAGLFALAEINVFHVQLNRETQTFSLNEIPLVLGLFFSSPTELLAGQILGVAVALILYRRQPLLKWSYNLAQFSLGSLAAVLAFRGFAELGGLLGTPEMLAAFVATTAAVLIGTIMVIAAITVTEGLPTLRVIARNLGFGAGGTWANTGLALLGVLLLRESPMAAWLLSLPAALLFLAYRGYTTYRLQNEHLAALAAATKTVERSVSLEPAMTGVLQSAKDMLRGEIAVICFFGEHSDDATLEVRLGPDGDVEMSSVELDPREGVWALSLIHI